MDVLIQTMTDILLPYSIYIQKSVLGSGLPSGCVGGSERFWEMSESRERYLINKKGGNFRMQSGSLFQAY